MYIDIHWCVKRRIIKKSGRVLRQSIEVKGFSSNTIIPDIPRYYNLATRSKMASQFDMIRSLGLQLQMFDYAAHTDDVGIEWKKWLRSFETMIRASRIEDEDWKKDLLLHYAGPSVQQLFDTLPEPAGVEMRGPLLNIENYTPNMTSYEEARARLNEFFLPKENSTYERHLLRQMKQKTGESIDAFTIRLRVQAERCGFGDRMEENIKDQIIQNCQSATLRRDLLKRGDASLEEVLSVAKIFETVAQQEKSFAAGEAPKPAFSEVNKIDAKPYAAKRKRFAEATTFDCHRCGYIGHLAKDAMCPAKGKTCNRCGGKDHFAKKCRKDRQRNRSDSNRWMGSQRNMSRDNNLDNQNAAADSDVVKHIVDENTEYVFNVTTSDSDGEIPCEIGGVVMSAVIDSGSKHNLLCQDDWEKLKTNKVVVSNQRRESTKVFKAYGGQPLPLVGVFTAMVKMGNKSDLAEFYVIKGKGKILIGRDTAMAMGVLRIEVPVNEVSTERGKLGTIRDIIVDIPIKPDIAPVIQPYRRVPVALEKMVDKKIDELLDQGVIEPVNGPAKWVSPVVVVPKGTDDVRICVDMRRANEAVERENHPLPTFEDFLPHLSKAKVFSRLDVKTAFHQVEISDQSRDITTFITRKGLFRYTRLMFGINCAPELFQKSMEQVLSGCEGCLVFIDDVIVFGSDQKEHDMRLEKVRLRLQERNVALNEDKCIYGVNEVEFLGHVLSEDGIKPSWSQFAISESQDPQKKLEVFSVWLTTWGSLFLIWPH
ncbi:uncharacterized protein K02A2.6-like [Aedes albopictus]|uniref:Reverse transcriptase domain-containing protein n=1 Tax=Aedes albopictus TaxID=7160 RepID=A0ABM1ZPG7_AEDAL